MHNFLDQQHAYFGISVPQLKWHTEFLFIDVLGCPLPWTTCMMFKYLVLEANKYGLLCLVAVDGKDMLGNMVCKLC